MSNRGRKNTKAEVESDVESDVEVSEEQPKKNVKGGAKKITAPAKKGPVKGVAKGAVKGKAAPAKKAVVQKGKKQAVGSKTAKKAAGGRSANKEEGKERYFKLIDAKTGRSYGRYTGDTPKQAASKGFTKMLQKLKTEGKHPPKQSTIYLRESTRGSARKVYGYEASRQKLPEPQQLVIKDKETGDEKTIVYHFRNKIKKVAVPEQIGGAKTARSNKKAPVKKGTNAASAKKGATGKATANKKAAAKSATGKAAANKKAPVKAASGSKRGSTGKAAPAKKPQNAKASSSR